MRATSLPAPTAEPGTRPAPRLLLPPARRSPWGFALALLVHAAVVGVVIYLHWREILSWEEILSPGTGGGEMSGGGGGGGGVRVVALPPLAAAPEARAPLPPPAPQLVPVETPPVPTPAVAVPEPVPPPVAAPPAVAAATGADSGSVDPGQGGSGTGGGRGSGVGTGTGSGVGPGSGAGSGPGSGGAGGRAMPPVPRQLILPPTDYPRSLRGRTVAVTFWVAADGRVERVALEPEPDDRGFAKRLVEVMVQYRFRPARSADGSPIPGTTTLSVSF